MEKCVYTIRKVPYVLGGEYGASLISEQKYISEKANIDDAMALCTNQDAIKKASELMSKVRVSDKDLNLHAVYAMESPCGKYCKVGITMDPTKRLKQFQTSHWGVLKFYCLAWSSLKSCEKIERLVLKAGAEMGISENGEWLSTDGHEATELIIKAARYAGAEIADSTAMVSNFNIRVKDLYADRRSKREKVYYADI